MHGGHAGAIPAALSGNRHNNVTAL